ncbi:3-oxo-5-alpha-steroid 4-dehydrogenase, C-terminal [Penicillium digitatum]|nr:3-oxo-5-alpha-steroid 4-dehydrogenase, C-terminal [Penicillium digitatum]
MGATISTCWEVLPSIAELFPPTPAVYTSILCCFQYFPLITVAQWVLSWHPAGKTSSQSIFNIPGRIAWSAMEIVGPINLIYCMVTPSPYAPSFTDLPMSNILVGTLYCIHYFNRAIISPFFSAPSMSPIHVTIMSFAMIFNWFNSACLAGWLRGYKVPTIPSFPTASSGTPSPRSAVVDLLSTVGAILFTVGMAGNIYSETALFRLRREEAQKRAAKKTDGEVLAGGEAQASRNKFHKVYVIPPTRGVFRYILYPHYVFEWLEWIGFALAGTAVAPLSALTAPVSASSIAIAPPLRRAPWLVPAAWAADKLAVPLPLPAIVFVVNAVTNMLPHARWGRKWYVEKFGEKAVAGRGAVLPGCSWM